jgi:hypothetical protein
LKYVSRASMMVIWNITYKLRHTYYRICFDTRRAFALSFQKDSMRVFLLFPIYL